MKFTFEQINNTIDLVICCGIMLLVTMTILFLYRIALIKFKSMNFLAVILSAISLIMWLIVPLVNIWKNVLFGMITLDFTCLAVITIILAIVKAVSNKKVSRNEVK